MRKLLSGRILEVEAQTLMLAFLFGVLLGVVA